MEKYSEQLKAYFQKFGHFNEEDWLYMISKYEIIEFKKDEILTSPNFVENKIYFILEGILRLHLDDPDHNLTLDFRFPGDFISSFSSLIKRLPSNYTL